MSETFAFGENWWKFLQVVNEERIALAIRSVQRLTGRSRLDGLRFLDIGSGSGLFSLAAHRLGANVTSFDVDADSVACTKEMKRRYAAADSQWRIETGSVLDEAFVASLGTFDVVYSWGVLHHTGSMWNAIENASRLLADNGMFCIALYNHQRRMTPYWTWIKRTYQRVPVPLRPLYAGCAMAPWEIPRFVLRPVRSFYYWKDYAKVSQRGMNRWRDIVDWVGGYPFETATPQQVVEFCSARGLLLYALTTVGSGLGCNQFGFVKSELPARYLPRVEVAAGPGASVRSSDASAAVATVY